MQSGSLTIYSKYRRLLILLLIFPIYKLFDALLHADYAIALIMLISVATGAVAIIYLERKLKVAQSPPQKRKPDELS